jgi:hypothetical protein
VGTALTFEGMGPGAAAESAEALAALAVRLHESEESWSEERARAAESLRPFSRPLLHARWRGFLEGASRNLAEARARNLVGLMLRHHQHNGSKYFSRWIEAKAARKA